MLEILILLFTGILLIVLNYKAIKNEDKSFSKALKKENVNINDYEIEIGRLKLEFSEDIAKLQSEILRLKEAAGSEQGLEKDTEPGQEKRIEQGSELSTTRGSEQGSYLDKVIDGENYNYSEIQEETADAPAPKADTTQAAALKLEQALHEFEVKGVSNNIRINEIKKMLDENLPMDEIAEKLNIGKGELLLIKDLYIK